MAVTYLSVQSNFGATSMFVLGQTEKPFSVFVPSVSAIAFRLEFALVNSPQATDFVPMTKPDGTGLPYTVTVSGHRGAFIGPLQAPTAWGRIATTTSFTNVCTLAIVN